MIDHEGRRCVLAPLCFLCDEMLRGVAGWLRVAGYDTVTPAQGMPDAAVLAQAMREDRWLITRDRGLLQHAGAANYVILLQSGDLESNLRELSGRLDIDWLYRPFSRCKTCNTPLSNESPPQPPQRIPLDILSRGVAIRYCDRCDRVFWEGSHVRRMRRRLNSLNGLNGR